MRKYNIPSDFIQTKALQPVVYKQYDNGDKLVWEPYDDGEKINLTNETVLAFFELADGTVIEKTCEIINGNAVATLDNNILSQSGKLIVEFTVYKDGTETSTRSIMINVEKSINRNQAIETIPQWDIVQQVLDLKASDGTAIEQKINVLNEAVEDKFNELSAAAQVDSEVVLARKNEATLGVRLDKLDAGLAEKAAEITTLQTTKADKTEINTLASEKANKAYVDQQISNIGNASPKGTYATLSALQTAFPTGTTGIYVVIADGKWYYWSGSAWTAGGTYQSTGFADEFIKYNMVSSDLIKFNGQKVYAAVPTSALENIIFVDKVFDATTLTGTIDNVSANYVAEYDFYTNDNKITGISAIMFITNQSQPGNITGFSGNSTFATETISLDKVRSYSKARTFTKTNPAVYIHLMVRVHVVAKEQFVNFDLRNLKLFVNGTLIPEVGTGHAIYAPATGSTITNETYADFNLVKYEQLKNFAKIEDIVASTARWKGKRAGFLGNSQTRGAVGPSSQSNRWSTLVCNELGMIEFNYGVNGSMVAQEDGKTNSFVERCLNMDTNLDVIFILGLINDYFSGTAPIGDVNSNDPKTVNGALRILFTGLQTKYPNAEIIFITHSNSYFNNKNTDQPNPVTGLNLTGYNNLARARAKEYGIPVIDLEFESGMDAAHNTTHRTNFTSDGLHWNDKGHVRVKDRVVGLLKSL